MQSTPIVSSIHDLTPAGQFGERRLLPSRGRAVAEGTTDAVLTENTVLEHFGATVRVVSDALGRISVVPTREATIPMNHEVPV